MLSQPYRPPTHPWPSVAAARWGRYALLVPEAPLLLLLVALHLIVGPSLSTALGGLLLTLWFGLRTGLLLLARRRIAAADYERAGRLLRVALWMHPFSADAHTLQGTLSLARGQSRAAIESLSRAAVYFPLHSHLHAMLSGAMLEEGDPEGAFLEARRAIDFDPANADAYLHLASAEQALGSSPELAERHLRLGLERCSDPADEAALRCALASLLIRQSRSGEAQLALAGVASLLDRCAPAQRAGLHFYLGELYRQIGEQEKARGHFSASETIDPHGRYAAAAWRGARL